MTELLHIELDGLTRRMMHIESIRERLKDLRPVFEFAHRAFMLEERAQFATEGMHINGVKWTPLSAAYAKRKPQPPPPYGILYRKGDMFRSLTEEGHPDHVKIITRKHAVFGTRDKKARFHHYGMGRLPQRKIIGMRNTFKKLVMRATLAYALRGSLPSARTTTGAVP